MKFQRDVCSGKWRSVKTEKTTTTKIEQAKEASQDYRFQMFRPILWLSKLFTFFGNTNHNWQISTFRIEATISKTIYGQTIFLYEARKPHNVTSRLSLKSNITLMRAMTQMYGTKRRLSYLKQTRVPETKYFICCGNYKVATRTYG